MAQLNFKIADELVKGLDELIDGAVFTNRAQLIRHIIARYIEHSKKSREEYDKERDELAWSCPITGDPSQNPYLLKGKKDV